MQIKPSGSGDENGPNLALPWTLRDEWPILYAFAQSYHPVVPQSRSQSPLHPCPADSGNEISHTTELAVCASLLNFVLLALESGPLYLFFVSYFIIIIYLFIYLFIVYVLCDGETWEDWDTLDFMQVTGMIEWG